MSNILVFIEHKDCQLNRVSLEAIAAAQSIAGDLRNQYLLGFYPNNSETEKSPGHIRVALAQKGLSVRAKKKLVF